MIRDEHGRLTEYSFQCGYLEQKTTDSTKFRKGDVYTELYMEHSHYQVRQFDYSSGYPVRKMWESFAAEDFADARKLFDEQPGALVVSTRNGECVTKGEPEE